MSDNLKSAHRSLSTRTHYNMSNIVSCSRFDEELKTCDFYIAAVSEYEKNVQEQPWGSFRDFVCTKLYVTVRPGF